MKKSKRLLLPILFRNIIIHSIVIVAFAGCDYDAVNPISSTPELKFKGGRVWFESQGNLQDFMAYAKDQDLEDFHRYIHSYEGSEFKSLLPLFEENDMGSFEEYKLYKTVENQRILERSGRIGPNLRSTQSNDLDLEEDAIIADPYYASILTREREILVDNYIYKYSLEGIYIVNENDVEDLYDYLEEIEDIDAVGNASGSGSNDLPQPPLGISRIQPFDDDVCAEGRCNDECPIGDPCDPSYGGGSGGTYTAPEAPNPTSLKLCDKLDGGLFTKVFGPKVTCSDHYSSTRRVKTKAWNQNYLLWASIGMSVRSQKKSVFIWWRSAISELKLGYSQASFRLPRIPIQWPNNDIDFYYEDSNGFLTDQWGRNINDKRYHPRSIFDNFPIKKGKDFFAIYSRRPLLKKLVDDCDKVADPCKIFDVSGKQINDAIKNLVVSSVRTFTNISDPNVNTNSVLAVEIAPLNSLHNDLTITYTNWDDTNYNKGKLANVFEWNTAQVGFKTNLGDGQSVDFKDFSIQSTARSYGELLLTGYGMGRRQGVWKGTQVSFKHDN